MDLAKILWRRLDVPGMDACRIFRDKIGWVLEGAAIYREEGVLSQLQYRVQHDDNWQTLNCVVDGYCDEKTVSCKIVRQKDSNWTLNDCEVSYLGGAFDIDLGFTPATNTTALQRLRLDVGTAQETLAAWLDPSDWQLKPLKQAYERKSEDVYAYTSIASGFEADLTVNSFNLVTTYPGLWSEVD